MYFPRQVAPRNTRQCPSPRVPVNLDIMAEYARKVADNLAAAKQYGRSFAGPTPMPDAASIADARIAAQETWADDDDETHDNGGGPAWLD